MSETPKFPEPTQEDLARWAKVATRFGFFVSGVRYAYANGTKFRSGIEIRKNKDDKKHVARIFDVESWLSFSDGHLYTQPPTWSMFYDRFQPHRAEFIERKIHPWIKMYKEPE